MPWLGAPRLHARPASPDSHARPGRTSAEGAADYRDRPLDISWDMNNLDLVKELSSS